jgi:NAD-dependent dihydropyrimidine dehydrogenase PreA subunit
MASLPYPVIDKDRCTGCRLCVDTCPTNALAQVAGKAELVYPEQCTYCTACEEKCPENAISLPFLVTFNTGK